MVKEMFFFPAVRVLVAFGVGICEFWNSLKFSLMLYASKNQRRQLMMLDLLLILVTSFQKLLIVTVCL